MSLRSRPGMKIQEGESHEPLIPSFSPFGGEKETTRQLVHDIFRDAHKGNKGFFGRSMW
ncbi:MAG: hypothetical protein JWM16_3327 [Verrucomicrobiales bacterium]|nr:hypothetical protein [Verrucomicrobiales bacterium]